MIDYDKIYKKSVYKENFELYLNTWKRNVAKKRLMELIPVDSDFKRLSKIDLLKKWQGFEKNAYSLFVTTLLQSYDGFELLRLFQVLSDSFAQKDNKEFKGTINCILAHLRLYPTLITYFPNNLMYFLKILQEESLYLQNVIIVSKRHSLSCSLCKCKDNLKFVRCYCSTAFLCSGCIKTDKFKCPICNCNYKTK